MVIYNLSSIFDHATGERQIVFLTSKVSLVSLAKLDFRVEELLRASRYEKKWPSQVALF